MRPSEIDMPKHILSATERLVAQGGLHNLSMQKIAREAKVSVGTIYLYFKDKETLLNQLVLHIFDFFREQIDPKVDFSKPVFEQYKQLWRATWVFFEENQDIVLNMHQYESLPNFKEIIKQCSQDESFAWNRLVKQGQDKGIIAMLPAQILYAMSIKVVFHIAPLQLVNQEFYSEAMLEEIILRTWKAISL